MSARRSTESVTVPKGSRAPCPTDKPLLAVRAAARAVYELAMWYDMMPAYTSSTASSSLRPLAMYCFTNTSAASIPIAIDEARKEGRIKEGDTVLLAAFGGGLTWASAIIRW